MNKDQQMFKWERIGQVFDLTKLNTHEWMQEQAQNPYVIDLNQFIRVYFNCRAKKDKDGKSKSYAGFVDLDKNGSFNILNISTEPVLQLGIKGSFDEFGIMAGSCIKIDQGYYLYYVGWTRMYSVPYNWSIGLAKSNDGINFSRFGRGPIIGPTYKEPYLQAGCSMIMKLDDIYHLWYTSGIKWIETGDKPESVYQIMHATSPDGIVWDRDGIPIIETIVPDEAQASPSIINIKDRWYMAFSYRHSTDFRNRERGYRLGSAWSDDLKTWHRDDSIINFNVSESGWDSEMVCYPHLSVVNNDVYLFYCGNDFGKNGFGVAKLVLK